MSGDPYPYGVHPYYGQPGYGYCHIPTPPTFANPAPDFPFTDHHLRGLIREIVREELRAAGVIKDATRNER